MKKKSGGSSFFLDFPPLLGEGVATDELAALLLAGLLRLDALPACGLLGEDVDAIDNIGISRSCE